MKLKMISLKLSKIIVISVFFFVFGCGGGGSSTSTSSSSVITADAGTDQTTVVGNIVTLDGRNSTTSDGNALNFTWTITTRPYGSICLLSDTSSIRPTFTPDVAGEYILQLDVSYGTLSSYSTVKIDAILRTAQYLTTPSVTPSATTFNSYDPEYWKVEFSGSDNGYCDGIFLFSNGGAVYNEGLCVTQNGIISNFDLSGIIDSNRYVTLNGTSSKNTEIAPIFRGTLASNGTGSGTWDITGTPSIHGTWTANRYKGIQQYTNPTISAPQAGSFASMAEKKFGIWRRPSVVNWPEFLLVAPDNSVAWQASSPNGGIGRVFGGLVFNGYSWNLASNSIMYDGTGPQSTLSASGSYNSGTIFSGLLNFANFNPVVLSFDSYSDDNALALELTDISGTYIADGVYYISNDGSVIGSVGNATAGCIVRGQITEQYSGAKVNLFNVNLMYYGTCSRGFGDGTWTGYMFIATSSTSRYLYSLMRPNNPQYTNNGIFNAGFVGSQVR